jgi:prevent-host-death family protein
MLADQCISVSELAKNASAIVKRVKTSGVQYVFVNNKPQAVLLDIDMFEKMNFDPDYLTPSEIQFYQETKADFDAGKNIYSLEELKAKYADKI